MKKLCLLLAIVSLLSCVLFSCSEKKKSNANAIITTERPVETTTTPPKQVTIWDIDREAIDYVIRSIKRKLRNPSSFQDNGGSMAYGEFKVEETTSSGEVQSKIYMTVYLDYSAQNGFGGTNREKVYIYLSCDANNLGKTYERVVPFIDFTEISYNEYYEAKEKGEKIQK